jgi:DNA-binding NtrC family response regulator
MQQVRQEGGLICVLVVDDERPTRLLMEKELPRSGFSVATAESGEQALEQVRVQDFDAILLDLKMPGMGGMEALRQIRASGTSAEVVILTGHPDVSTAIEGMKLGAYDYLTKPFKLAEVEVVLRRAAERNRLQRENLALRRMVAQRTPAVPMVGTSPAVQAVLGTIGRIAGSDANVLLEGESGTGKGLAAQAIHQQSGRAAGPFLAVNCGGFQEPLLESELFGHEKGAFTGATSTKLGLFEVAERGTLFLDEVGEMSPAMQAKLLQVLDTREIRRVGGTRVHRMDVRVVAATNKDLAAEVTAGRFREDLFYRLNVVNLVLPPLRERREDIPLLVAHFARQLTSGGREGKVISPEAMECLRTYRWPGNVRELANTVERLFILAPGTIIRPEDLPSSIRSAPPAELLPAHGPLSLAEMERLHVRRVLGHTRGKKMQAARLLGIDIKTLNKKIKDYGIILDAKP